MHSNPDFPDQPQHPPPTPSFSLCQSPNPQAPSCSSPSVHEYRNGSYAGRLNRQQQMHGSGLVVYDDGCVLAAGFLNGDLYGHFLCFLGGNQWVSGRIIGGTREGVWTWGLRHQGGIVIVYQKGIIVQQFQFSSAGQDIPSKLFKQYTYPNPTPTQYLQKHLSSSVGGQKEPTLFEISEQELYYGLTDEAKPHGIGIIFMAGWPVCFGQFRAGNLEGLARVLQADGSLKQDPNQGQGDHQLFGSRTIILDGLFRDSKLCLGWIIDAQFGGTAFGNIVKRGDKTVFQIKEEFVGIQQNQIEKFRRRVHLQSLCYSNSYIPSFPSRLQPPRPLQPRSMASSSQPSPTSLQGQEIQSPRQHNFIPSYISEISRLPSRPAALRESQQSKGKDIVDPENDDRRKDKDKEREKEKEKQKEETSGSVGVERELIDLIKEYQQGKSLYDRSSRVLSEKISDSDRFVYTRIKKSKEKGHLAYNRNISDTSKSRDKSIKSNEKSGLRNSKQKVSGSKSKEKTDRNSKIGVKTADKSQKLEKRGLLSSKKALSNLTGSKREAETQRIVPRRVNLQQIYSKHLRKQYD